MNAPIRTMVLVGSVRPGSLTQAAAAYAAALVKEGGHEALVWDLSRLPLPIADPAYHDRPADHPDKTVRALASAAARADCFLLSSPVYHNSYSGVLKNALDCLTIEHFRGKSVGLLANGPKLTAVQACDHLRSVVRGLYGLCVPEQVVTTPGDFTGRDDGTFALTDTRCRERMHDLVQSVIKLGRR